MVGADDIPNSAKLRWVFNERYVLYLSFLALGFNKYILYVPLFAIFYFLKLGILDRLTFKKSYAIYAALMTAFVVTVFMIGAGQLTIESPLKLLVVILFSFLVAGYALHYQSFETKLILLGLYVFGMFFESTIIVAYSFITDPLAYGYGKLASPFGIEEFNSPSTSNVLGIVFAFYYYLAIYGHSKILKNISIILIILSIGEAFFLGGRTFFVIAVMTVLFFLITKYSIRKILKVISVLFAVILSLVVLYKIHEPLSSYFDFIMFRFESGLESTRFLHYAHALKMIPTHPFGGFDIDTSIEPTKWFHNLWFDSARVAGWLPNFWFFLAMLYSLKSLLQKFHPRDYVMPLWMVIASLLIMAQDVIIEGNVRILFVYFFSSIIIMSIGHPTRMHPIAPQFKRT